MKAYETTKYSGINFLGEIPEHWQLWKFKTITSILTCGYASTPEYVSEENGVPFLSAQNVKPGRIVLDKYNFISKKLHSELTRNKKPIKGDVLVARVGGEGNIGDAALVDLDFEFSVYVSLTHIRPRKNLYNKFLIYFFQSAYSRLLAKIETQVGGGVGNLNVKDMERYKLPIPPLPEQRQIAAYLDYKTKQIDRFIANRKKQIELLEEQKEVIINKAVTKGIDPTVRLKPSGVDWIGDIPEHWEVKPFKSLFKFSKGLSITKADLLDKGIPCVNYGEIHSKFGFELIPETHKLKCVPKEYLSFNKSLLKFGDFVFADTSEDIEGCGNFTYLNSSKQTFAGYHTVITKPKKVFKERYIAYFFESLDFRNQIRSRVYGVKVFSITNSILKSTFVVLPPFEEQKQISEYIDNEISERNELISKYQKQIDLMQEYKTSLISKAVTGKIDVREWQPKQPIKETV